MKVAFLVWKLQQQPLFCHESLMIKNGFVITRALCLRCGFNASLALSIFKRTLVVEHDFTLVGFDG